MQFEPARNEFITNFEKILTDMCRVTGEVSRVISHTEFHQFTHALISENGGGPRFSSIVEGSEAYASSKATIQGRISQDFDELQEIVNKFGACRPVDDFARDFVFNNWRQEHSDLESIKNMLFDLDKWENLIGRCIRNAEQKGLILVQGKRLASRLTGRVQEEQKHMKDYLHELAQATGREIGEGLRNIRGILETPPKSLSQYVDYVNKVENCQVQKDELAERKKRLEEMKTVLSKYRSKDESYPNVSITTLQIKIESLT
jgi:hypothetical protein